MAAEIERLKLPVGRPNGVIYFWLAILTPALMSTLCPFGVDGLLRAPYCVPQTALKARERLIV